MKIRIAALALAFAAILPAQHRRFSWQESCFKNPGLPYCQGHEYAIKKPKPSKEKPGTTAAPSTADDAASDGIDWRFVDPQAEWLAGFNFNELRPSPLARTLLSRLGAMQGLTASEMQAIFDALAGVQRIAVSAVDKRVLIMAVCNAPPSAAPSVEPGWRTARVGGNAILAGDAESVDRALERLAADGPLSDLAALALERQGNSDVWVAGSGKMAVSRPIDGEIARFSIAASIQEQFNADLLLDFKRVPDAGVIRNWPRMMHTVTFDGDIAHISIRMEGDEVLRRFDEIAASLVGERLGALLAAARHIPATSANTAGHDKPVVYGLDQEQ